MAGLKCTVLLVFMIAVVVMAHTAEAQVCSTQLSNLNVCAPFVVPGASVPHPTSDCCVALGALNHDCICNTLRIASQLPSLCNVPAVPCGMQFLLYTNIHTFNNIYNLHSTSFFFLADIFFL
ncbi:protein MEN-8-like [Humulus lupulus]|uniref:protein MEN-8-like n=1 Tax=Humulus lupulus TaxID=3486 RepID=UPI002B4088CB|nr:protein MEN-8-like [Humulus lupulus]